VVRGEEDVQDMGRRPVEVFRTLGDRDEAAEERLPGEELGQERQEGNGHGRRQPRGPHRPAAEADDREGHGQETVDGRLKTGGGEQAEERAQQAPGPERRRAPGAIPGPEEGGRERERHAVGHPRHDEHVIKDG
jgi:hypothetical protein